MLTVVKNGEIIGFGFPVMIGLYFCQIQGVNSVNIQIN